MNNILEISGLSKRFDAFSLRNVSFAVPQGFIMGFIGPNGAGKTTTIKLMLNMLRRDGGDIKLLGLDSASHSAEAMERIGVVMDTPFYADDWTLYDVERAVAPFYSHWGHAAYTALLERFGLSAKKRVKELSRGMKVKLMLAVALSHRARLLILDEPTSGLDPVARDELADILKEFITDEKNGVLFSTHITADLEKIADYITFIRSGEIVFTGTTDALLERYVLVKGGPTSALAGSRKYIIGCREHPTGWEGIALIENLGLLPPGALTEPVSLDEIILYMNKEGKAHV